MTETTFPFSAALQRAAREARLWLGATAPNPPVGAVALDEQGMLLAAAAHQQAGEPHAEAALLIFCREQGLLNRVHTVAVTLEPCNHTGRTPPCSEALIAAGIKRVVVGTDDPNPHVSGGGCARLSQAGIEVIHSPDPEPYRQLIHSFAFYTQTGKPFVTVKRAFNKHGSMIPPKGQKTFTNEKSLILAHRVRKKADAIVTGSGTILSDTPLFTVRYVSDHPDKRRFLAILDRRGRVPDFYKEESCKRRLKSLIFQDLDDCFATLADLKIQDVLVEAGPTLSDAILASNHWTMCIDIHTDPPEDRVNVTFNPNASLPFDPQKVELENMLPL
ncbi:MAG: bifunctional diaminohydroxyphosphoribosylaminopyrimidine deaminase/5-amino-6-(5-phosphoribosylamino)uracil reductase RibD [Alphaproteobacteria bacterium]|nr:bifunctional diaminohydroxyphosphoribosylaminopyrimidine deaminase/5-amino-6-(5-phosphoribosylamino)uracil reductase RibD [Alphaproteobacteria bacterium]